jgi:hypothetical protein
MSNCTAFDIETLGVNKHKDLITVVAFYNPEANISKVLRFVDMDENGNIVYSDDYKETVKELIGLMDSAEMLCSFNGVSFDIPFIQIQFGIDNATVQAWVLKTYDVLELTRRGFKRTFNLNLALALNQVGSGKTGSGMEAVNQARSGDWKSLESYCQDDARLTYELSFLKVVNCPEGYQWRKSHGDRSHDATNVFKIDTSSFPEISFRTHGPAELRAM